jgi:hypothetical protein
MSLNGAKFITFLIAAALLIVATLVKADDNAKPFFSNPTINHQVIP